MNMVMSMDAATGDQSIGSPMDDSTLSGHHNIHHHHSVRHQESADDEQNEDEQSKASGQTVVDKSSQRQQQQQQQTDDSKTIQAPDSVQSTEAGHRKHQQQQQDSSEQKMLVSREQSLEDDSKSMMTDADANLPKTQQHRNPEFDEDPAAMISRMRDIVEGRAADQQASKPNKNSSGDSLNHGTTENNSKGSQDSATNQKRSRHAHHCSRHHHHHHNHNHQQQPQHNHQHQHHHHHRQSVSTITSQTSCQHQYHRHHHHHHHHQQQKQQTGIQEQQHVQSHHHHRRQHHHEHHAHQGCEKATSSRRFSSSQRPEMSGSQTASNQHQANMSSSSMPLDRQQFVDSENNKSKAYLASESKSSNSSVSSAPQMQHQEQTTSSLNDTTNNKSNQLDQNNNDSSDVVNDENIAGESHCIHHRHGFHHHHHSHGEPSASHHSNPPHHHHYHNHGNGRHHHHHHHHHHRKYKKRLVLDAEGQPITDTPHDQDQENRPSTTVGLEEGSAGNHGQDLADECGKPLQEIETNITSTTNPCPYHDHRCPSHGGQRGMNPKFHPHHHHHHHQHQHQYQHRNDKETTSVTAGDQQQASTRGHHHHHHRHHHHHHNHQHHSRPRNRKHKSSSNKNLDGQVSGKELDMGQDGQVVMDEFDRRQSQPVSAYQHDFQHEEKSDEPGASKGSQLESDNRMLLDDDTQLMKGPLRSVKSEESNEVVNMDMSPNNEKPKNTALGMSDSEALVNSTNGTEADLITSIEVMNPGQQVSKLDQNKGVQGVKNITNLQAKDSDIGSQGDSGNRQSARGEGTHEFVRNREGDSIRGHHDKPSHLIRQASSSRESSQKENSRKTGGTLKQDQQLIECSPISSESHLKPSQPKQIIESTVSPDRRCRLCWCCCCPCSGLSSRNNQSKSEAKPIPAETSSSATKNCPAIPNVSLETIRSWGDSFDRLMKCPDGRKVFQDFLRCEYSEENILFWIACEELKNEKDAKSIVTKARDIYEDYISILSAKEVSLDSRVRDIINNNIKKPTSNIFDEAQLQIYTLMHRDSYPRFINSPMYKKLAQIQTTSRKSST